MTASSRATTATAIQVATQKFPSKKGKVCPTPPKVVRPPQTPPPGKNGHRKWVNKKLFGDQGKDSQLKGDPRHGDPSRHQKVSQKKGQGMPNAAQSSKATATPAPNPGTAPATQHPIVGKRFG